LWIEYNGYLYDVAGNATSFGSGAYYFTTQ
jgi:hypothetical protein